MSGNEIKPKSLAELESEMSKDVVQEQQEVHDISDAFDDINEEDVSDELESILGSSDSDSAHTEGVPLNREITFDDDESVPKPTEPLTPKQKQKSELDSLLKTVSVDLNNITFRKSDDPLELFEEIKSTEVKPTYEIIALQSAYRASFRPLNLNTRIIARKLSGTAAEQTRKLLQIIYNHLDSTNLGKISFENWLKVTAEADINTIVFGIYAATYPKESEYSIGCPSCKTRNDIRISKERLIKVIDTKAYELVSNIINKNLPIKELIKESCVNHVQRICLPDSKHVIDLCTPTLFDMLKSLDKAHLNKQLEPEIFGYMKYISKFAILSIKSLKKGKVEYIELNSEDQLVDCLNNLSEDDKTLLTDSINDKLKQYEVNYKLPDTKCAKCNFEITDIDVGMTEVLFTKLAQG